LLLLLPLRILDAWMTWMFIFRVSSLATYLNLH
jgi:hypothetical protein